MKDIALSWLEARQNQYMQAGKGDLFSFRNFDEGIYDEKETLRRKPQFLKRPETDNEYDRQMFERIRKRPAHDFVSRPLNIGRRTVQAYALRRRIISAASPSRPREAVAGSGMLAISLIS